ncbi:hypothetical protein LIER_40443 [Lithospermum erythrorhizon]|uniref:Uncharacterized protein n=1 Tax=Lithospermum erythrorhizon TaxID=34254 RepID=A0AAV3QUS6_LITER
MFVLQPTKQEKGKDKKLVNESKRRTKPKKGETSGAAANPFQGTADPVQQQAADPGPVPRPVQQQAADPGPAPRPVFRAPRPAPIAWADHNEDDDIVEILSLPEQSHNDASDVEILKVVQDTTIDPSVSQRETRRAKRGMVKHKAEQAKKKRRKS